MAQETKKGFILYYDYRRHLSLLSDQERGKLLLSLLDYGEKGIPPELEGAAQMAFSFIRAQMDRDAQKYAETVQRRSRAGKLGGRPSQTETEEEREREKTKKAKKANGFSQNQENQIQI